MVGGRQANIRRIRLRNSLDKVINVEFHGKQSFKIRGKLVFNRGFYVGTTQIPVKNLMPKRQPNQDYFEVNLHYQ